MNERHIVTCMWIVVVALILAVAATIMSVMVLVYPEIINKHLGTRIEQQVTEIPEITTPQPKEQKGDKIYVFGYDVPWGEYQFVNEEGVLRGASVDLVDAICKESGKICRHVVTPIEACWDTKTRTGEGILARWFDACAIFLRTTSRENIFRYSGRLFEPKRGEFYALEENGVALYQLGDSRLGVRTSWYIGSECLARNDLHQPRSITYAKDTADLGLLLKNGTVDLIFSEEGVFANETSFKQFSDKYACALGGSGVMHRVDSDIPEWFDTAADDLRRRGMVKEICSKYPSVKNCLD